MKKSTRKRVIKPKSRVVVFVLYQLAPLHKGIQSAHAVSELLRKYCGDLNPERTVSQALAVRYWADNDKTLIILDGGTSKNLAKIRRSIPAEYPSAVFKEPDLYNKITAVAVLDDGDSRMPYRLDGNVDVKAANFKALMKECKLAN